MPNDLVARLRSGFSLGISFLALLAVGPLLAIFVARLRGPNGGTETTLLISDAPATGVLALLALGVGAMALGAAKSKMFGWQRGFTVAGFVLAWGAFRTGDTRLLMLSLPEGTSILVPWLIESVLAIGVAMAIAHVIVVVAGKSDQQPSAEEARDRSGLFSPAGLAGIGASAVIMALLTWILVQTPLRGQAVVGSAIAAIGASAAGILASRQFGGNTSILGPMIGIALCGLVAPAIAIIMAGDVADAARGHTMLVFAYVQPLDWASALMLGTPVGVGWAASSAEQAEDRDDRRTPRSASRPASAGTIRTRRTA